MEETEKLKNDFNKIDFNNDESIIRFINNIDADTKLMSGTNSDGNTIVISAEKGVCLKLDTYLDNGFIRSNIYTIDDNDLIKEEIYEPSGN